MKNIDCTACKIIPNTKFVIFESDYWIISLASDQHWLGRSYVTSKKHVESLSELSASSWSGLKVVIECYEKKLKQVFGARLFNWSCLMNDAYSKAPYGPTHVHWHVRPRYENSILFSGIEFKDQEFGKHYRTRWDGREDFVIPESAMLELQKMLTIAGSE